MLSLDKDDSSNSEKIWKKNNFFWDQNANFTTKRPNLENTLVYCNQGTISTLKTEDHAIYLAYVILGQIIPANNSPPDLDNYVLEENEVRLHVPLYNNESGLAFIMTQEARMRFFFSYGYDEERSKVLYSSFKHPLPNIFQGIAFKKHAKMLIEEKKLQETSKLFFFLQSITGCKEKIKKMLNVVKCWKC